MAKWCSRKEKARMFPAGDAETKSSLPRFRLPEQLYPKPSRLRWLASVEGGRQWCSISLLRTNLPHHHLKSQFLLFNHLLYLRIPLLSAIVLST